MVQSNDPKKVALRIAAVYMMLGALWILVSDKFAAILVSKRESLTFISMIKGWVYVAATGILLFTLVFNALKRAKAAENELMQRNQELMAAKDEIALTCEQLAASEAIARQQFEESRQNQKQLLESELRYRLISEATNDAFWEKRGQFNTFSDRWYEITGYTRSDMEEIGDWTALINPDDLPIAQAKLQEHITKRTPHYSCQYRLRTKSGEYKWVQARGKAIFDKGSISDYMIGSHTDITDLKEYERKLYDLAYRDQLTGLKNRASLAESMKEIMSRRNGKKCALLFIDIDNFKYINDSMGHTFGDRVLKQIGERLMTLAGDNFSVYRLGGDEFVILIDNFSELTEIEKTTVKILKELKNRIEIDSSTLFNTVSIGVSIYPEHGNTMDELLKKADIAVYKAKNAGKNRIVIYDEPMNEGVIERMRTERCLRTALENNEFELYYQPQLDLHTNKISGFEALLRWHSAELGFVSPERFIKIAEDTHLIIPIGEWAMRNACIFLKRMHQTGYKDLTVSVNVSMLQLLQDDFVDFVVETLELAYLDPKHLEIEITESILMESYEAIAGKLKLLKASGVKIALDDFGKGYSSLNYLRHLPISTLKIDKTFIDTITGKEKNKSLTDLIVKIGKSMDLCVVAEGVETQEQLDYLIKHKCTKIQGYLFSKPLAEIDAINRLIA